MIVEAPTLDDPRLDAYARLTDADLSGANLSGATLL